MKAAILFEQNKPLILEELKLPDNLRTGQVLIKVHLSGICGSQIGEIMGVKGIDKYLPHLMGHEGCGTVVETGPGVKKVKKGDLVVLHWRKGEGIQSDVPKYFLNDQIINAGWVTTFNSEAIVSENRCTKIPSDTDYKVAALFGCAVTTGFGVIENNAKLKMGESIVIFGAGGIGLNIIQAAKLVSAQPIIAVDIFDNRLRLAEEMGATHTINSQTVDPKNEIKSILGQKSLDVFIDNTGMTKIIELGYELISDEGRLVLVGVPKKGQNINIYTLPLHFGKKIIGSHGGECNPTKDIPRYLSLVNSGKIDLLKTISNSFTLEEINLAINEMKKGSSAGRILIYP